MPWDPTQPGATSQADNNPAVAAPDKPMVVSGNQQRYRREFNNPAFPDWDYSVGAGMTANATNSNLVVTTGTTANSVTTFTTKQSFGAPFNIAFGFKVSQKITNQEFYLEIVAEDPATGALKEDVVAAWRIAGADSTTATIARAEVRNGGASRLQSANLSGHASQTSDTFYEITLEADEVWFHSRLADAITNRSPGYVRNTIAPDPNFRYRGRIRIVNGGTAPASTTTVTLSAVTVVDFTEIQASIQGGAGNANAAQAIPVIPVGGTQAVSGTVTATAGGSATATGTTVAKVLSAATANPTVVKASAGRVYGFQIANNSASWRYVKFYNQTTAPTPGAVPYLVVPLPPASSVHVDRAVPITFATGIGYTIVAGAADADTAVVGANEVVGHILYV